MFLKLQDGEDQFLYNEQTGEIFQVHPDNVLERLEVTIEQLSRFRPYIAIMETKKTIPEDLRSLK